MTGEEIIKKGIKGGWKKKEIEQDALKLTHQLGVKITTSAFMLWLHSNWKKGDTNA